MGFPYSKSTSSSQFPTRLTPLSCPPFCTSLTPIQIFHFRGLITYSDLSTCGLSLCQINQPLFRFPARFNQWSLLIIFPRVVFKSIPRDEDFLFTHNSSSFSSPCLVSSSHRCTPISGLSPSPVVTPASQPVSQFLACQLG